MDRKVTPRVDALEATTNVLKAYRELFEGNLLKALYYIDKALELEPDFCLALFLRGLILTAKGEIREAIESFENLMCGESKNPISWIFLGQLYGMSGNCEDALKCYNKALGIENRFPSAFLLKTICLEFLGEYDELLKTYDDILAHTKNFVPMWVKKAEILSKLGRYEEALLCLDKALNLKPHDKNALYLKGVLLKRMGKVKEALRCFKKLIDELNVRWIDAIRHAVSLCLIVGEFKDTERYIDMGLKIREDDVALWYFKGELFERLGKLDEALKCYEKVIELQPHYVKALLSKARIHEKKGEVEEAIKYYNKALENRHIDLE
jgi:tetratricopeptide (TPR) repeat protein